mmetsp:Transcript_27648/g.80807  ORF Transcript_27648/g.80807 Transcript_27648/m.80807 type:complete len:276 (+) Transcript_27648:2425-3252(+)
MWEYGHCRTGAWSTVSYRVTTPWNVSNQDNLVVELEVLGDSIIDPHALELFAYRGPTPPRASIREEPDEIYHKTSGAVNNLYAITLNYVQVKKALQQEASVAGEDVDVSFSFAVKCSDTRETVRYRILSHSVTAELHVGHRQHGEVCPEKWLYHFLSYSVSDDDGHRRQRRLGGQSNDDEEDEHVMFKVRILDGGVYLLAARSDFPPSFNSNNLLQVNPDHMALGHAIEYDFTICNAKEHLTYVGLFGNVSGCALYDITPVAFSGACKNGIKFVG